MDFGQRLRVLRKDAGLTQAQVAESVGVSRRTYVSYEQEGKRPRKVETYEGLARALGCDVKDLLAEDSDTSQSGGIDIEITPGSAADGVAAGMIAAAAFLGSNAATIPAALSLLPIALGGGLVSGIVQAMKSKKKAKAAPLTYAQELLSQLEKERRRFAATARGLIYSALASSGVSFAPAASVDDIASSGPDEAISVDVDGISSWWLVFEVGKTSAGEGDPEQVAELRAKTLMARLCDWAPDPARKASIVVEDQALFDALVSRRGKNSYRGNVSAILVDTDEAKLVKEEYYATYEVDADTDALMRICPE